MGRRPWHCVHALHHVAVRAVGTVVEGRQRTSEVRVSPTRSVLIGLQSNYGLLVYFCRSNNSIASSQSLSVCRPVVAAK